MSIEEMIRQAVSDGIRESMPAVVAEVLAKVVPMRASPSPQTTALLSPKQAADLMNVDEKTVRRWAKAGQLKHGRVGRSIRIDPKDLSAFVAGGADSKATTTDDIATRLIAKGR